eukprot:3406474-Prymnesium_polylepis.1
MALAPSRFDDEFIKTKETELAALSARAAALEVEARRPPLTEVKRQREAKVDELLDNLLPLPANLPAVAPGSSTARPAAPEVGGFATPRAGSRQESPLAARESPIASASRAASSGASTIDPRSTRTASTARTTSTARPQPLVKGGG